MSASRVDRDDPMIGRFVVVETWHPDVQEINARVDVQHDWLAIANEEHFGYVAERGFIVTSKDYWRFIKDLFPPDTEFDFFRDIRKGDLGIRISQRLHDDPERRIRSSQILLTIREDDLDNYLYPDMERARQNDVRHVAERGLADFVIRKLKDRDASGHSTPPIDKWVVPSEIFQGDAVVVS